MCPSSSQHLTSHSHPNPVSSSFSVLPSIHTSNPPPSLTNTDKTISSKITSPKTTAKNPPTHPPNHPQLIFTYPLLASSIPPPQTQHAIPPLTHPLAILIIRSIASASWGPSKESLCTLYKAFIRPILTYASAGLFSFASSTHITSVERMHRSFCRVITGCLSSTPIPLLHVEALLPPLRVSLSLTPLSPSLNEPSVYLQSFPYPLLPILTPAHVSKKAHGDPSPDHITLPLTYISPMNL